MEGHEDARLDPQAPGAPPAHKAGPPSPADGPLAPEHVAIAQHAAKIAVELLEPIILSVSETVRKIEGELGSRIGAIEQAVPEADESRLDSLEKRIKAFGHGGESVGDALALAAFALATARAIAAAVERSQGVSIPLPPTPDSLAEPLGDVKVVGADVAGSL